MRLVILSRNESLYSTRALVESARTMTNILEKTTDGFFAVDSVWKLTYINAEAETMVGQKRDALLGGLLWEKFPALFGDPKAQAHQRLRGRGT